MNLKQLWSIIRGRRTNYQFTGMSMTYYPDGDPMTHQQRRTYLAEAAQLSDPKKSLITVTVSGKTGSGKSAVVGEIEIALKAIGVPVTVAERDTMVVADYQHWIDIYKPEVVIIEQNIPVKA